MAKRRVVILGGGYAGLAALRKLSKTLPNSGYSLDLIDASRHHTVKTRFHELIVDRRKDVFIRHPIELFGPVPLAVVRRSIPKPMRKVLWKTG